MSLPVMSSNGAPLPITRNLIGGIVELVMGWRTPGRSSQWEWIPDW